MRPSVTLAARSVGAAPGSVWRLKKYDAGFRAALDAALAEGRASYDAWCAEAAKLGLAPSRRRRTGWTPERQAAFLDGIERGERVGALCRAAGLSTASLSALYARAPEFYAAMMAAAARRKARATLEWDAGFAADQEVYGVQHYVDWRWRGASGPLTVRVPGTGRVAHRGSEEYFRVMREKGGSFSARS